MKRTLDKACRGLAMSDVEYEVASPYLCYENIRCLVKIYSSPFIKDAIKNIPNKLFPVLITFEIFNAYYPFENRMVRSRCYEIGVKIICLWFLSYL